LTRPVLRTQGSTRPTTPSIASVAEVRRRKGFFASFYSWCCHRMLNAERRNRRQHTPSACICSHANDRCTLLFRYISSRPFSCSLSCKVPTIPYRTTPMAYGVPEMMHARRRTISILATATRAFFLLPVPLHIRLNLSRSTGSFLMATQEFSTRVARMNSEPTAT